MNKLTDKWYILPIILVVLMLIGLSSCGISPEEQRIYLRDKYPYSDVITIHEGKEVYFVRDTINNKYYLCISPDRLTEETYSLDNLTSKN